MTNAIINPTAGEWQPVSTIQTMHDGTVLRTWGVAVAGTQQWVGKAHAIGPEPNHQAEARANAGLFAASKLMAATLAEAVGPWADHFDSADDRECPVSGADLLDWFVQWRLRAKAVLDAARGP
jgi:hypothetical protein